MYRRVLIAIIALLSSLAMFVNVSAAAVPNGGLLLAQTFADAAQKSSVSMTGTFSGSSYSLTLNGGFAAKANGGTTTDKGVGSIVEIQPNGAKYAFVKGSSIGALSNFLEIKAPKVSEINVWYKITSKDPRFSTVVGQGADTVAQVFSFSSIGWRRTATYEGTAVLKGVRVFKLSASSNLFVEKSGFARQTLYITDAVHPLPFAMTGPAGTSGLLYFSKWDRTLITLPRTTTNLPR